MGQEVLQKFELLRPGFGNNQSGIMPGSALPNGTLLRVSAVDPDSNQRTFAVATAANGADGIMTRPLRTTFGLTDTEQLFGFTSPDGGGESATPFTVSVDGSIEPIPDEFIYEGIAYLQTSTVNATQVTPSTAVDTELAAQGDGRLGVAVTGNLVQFKVRKQLTVTDTTVAAAEQVRIQIYRVEGYKK
jgi:hypothetical protein